MLDDFLVRAALAGVGVALAAAPLGCFVVWRRMAYFGDATAHAAILGVALSLALGISVLAGALATALAMGLAIGGLPGRGGWAVDTLLGVAAHSALALGLVAASYVGGVRIDLMAYLVGDVLSVGRADLAVIWGGGAAIWAVLLWRWDAMLTATVDPDLAHAAGIDPDRERMVLTVTLAVAVAVALKVVGVLLIAAMLIVPAAAARPLARTPEGMLAGAAAIGAAAALGGLAMAWRLDSPAGPSIVAAAAAAFVVTGLAGRLAGRGG